MNTFRFFWNAHKYTGITIAAFLLVTATTGFLLLLKKEYAWIQPPTQTGQAGGLEQFISIPQAWAAAKAQDHPDFQSAADLDRIDIRPENRIYKMRSKHNNAEIQVDAVSGAVLSSAVRRSDWIETLHDGSWLGKPVHDFVMPLVALAVLFLVFSGMWLWLSPIVKRRRRNKALRRATMGRP